MNDLDAEIEDHLAKLTDPAVAFFHARRLSEMGDKVIPLLCEALTKSAKDPTEPSHGVTAWLIKALRDIGIEAVPALMELLQNPNAQVRWAAASALGKIESSEHLATLSEILINDSDASVRWMIASALSAHLDHPKVIETFLQVATDTNPYLRWIVISSLSRLPNATFDVFLAIVNALKDSDEKVRKAAKEALGEVQRFFFFLYKLSSEDKQLFNSLCLMLDEEFFIKKKNDLI